MGSRDAGKKTLAPGFRCNGRRSIKPALWPDYRRDRRDAYLSCVRLAESTTAAVLRRCILLAFPQPDSEDLPSLPGIVRLPSCFRRTVTALSLALSDLQQVCRTVIRACRLLDQQAQA